ncbi:MAG: GGDEF domain-containing protein [Moraxellaceae bacterium]|nr:MAG: GGDEF domain-containing protein [Moraxellaceae bacterium]
MIKTATVALPEETLQEDQFIRKLLADRRRIGRSFPDSLETLFWQSLAERSLHMIRSIATLGVLIYFIVGLITFPSIYLIADQSHRLHDILIWFLMYLNGAVCLATLPVIANIPGLMPHFQRFIVGVSFVGIFFSSFLTMQYEEPRLTQQGGYIVVFVYMLIYFLTGTRPLILWITCLIAGLLPLPLLWLMEVKFDPMLYFYSVIFSNFVGFFVSQSIIGKERISFLQARLLELDKLHSKLMSNELIRLSNEDPLTSLYNRRYFNESIRTEWDRAERSGEPLSLVFVDIDCFKNYNDTYGHLKGDDALIKVAVAMKEQMRRSSDMAARYGGEEFILLLPNTPSSGAQVVANNIMKAIDELKVEHKASLVGQYLTLSIGVATWAGETDMTETQLIAQADLAVYQAKSDGRHRVRIFGQSAEK